MTYYAMWLFGSLTVICGAIWAACAYLFYYTRI
jgi:hypothetical protein